MLWHRCCDGEVLASTRVDHHAAGLPWFSVVAWPGRPLLTTGTYPSGEMATGDRARGTHGLRIDLSWPS